MLKPRLTREQLMALLHYDPETGLITNKTTRCGRALKGAVAGGDTGKGYIAIRIDGRNYLAHQLAWLFTYGEWPTKWLDHRNRVRNDNRIANLREVTPLENRLNSNLMAGAKRGNKSGTAGVWAPGSKWAASIGIDYQNVYLGTFPTYEEAVAAKQAADRVRLLPKRSPLLN